MYYTIYVYNSKLINKETTMNRIELATKNHEKGYNCAQAVACAFSDVTEVDEQLIFKITEGMGLGMGCMRGTCGAVNGAITILGMLNSTGNLESPDSKADTYKLSKELVHTFQEKNQSIVCKELKGIDTKEVLRSCPGCVADAAEILESILKKENLTK